MFSRRTAIGNDNTCKIKFVAVCVGTKLKKGGFLKLDRNVWRVRGRLWDSWVSFNGSMIGKLRSDVSSLFQSIWTAWRKDRFEIFSSDVITGRARAMQFVEQMQLDRMEMRLRLRWTLILSEVVCKWDDFVLNTLFYFSLMELFECGCVRV